MKILKLTQFGDLILRQKAGKLSASEIKSNNIQELIADMQHTLIEKKLGIGLAAPQVGKSIALAVVCIRPLPHRPKVKPFDVVLINPEIMKTTGRKKQVWEGCISSGNSKAGLFAKVPRYTKIKVSYYDEAGNNRVKEFKDLEAQVIQHEIDHLNGVLFVDRVKDPSTYMTRHEYTKMITRK